MNPALGFDGKQMLLLLLTESLALGLEETAALLLLGSPYQVLTLPCGCLCLCQQREPRLSTACVGAKLSWMN